MSLTAEQRGALHDAFLSAFPTKGALEQVVSFGLDEELAEITLADDLRQVVARLLLWARAQGREADLVRAAHRANPGNAELEAFLTRYPDLRPVDEEPPVVTLRDLPSPLTRHDRLFQQFFGYLRERVLDGNTFRARVLEALEQCVPARWAFVVRRAGGHWQALGRDATTHDQIDTLLERDPQLGDLLLRACEHARENRYFSRGVSACRLPGDAGLCVLVPTGHFPDNEVLVLYGIPPTRSPDITLAVMLDALLQVTGNLTRMERLEDIELAIHNALRSQLGYVSDQMYDRQFNIFRQRLRDVTMYFEPIVSLHYPPSITAWEALARDPRTCRAPVDLFTIAQLWGQQFRTELDLHCLRLATSQYAAAVARTHADSSSAMRDLHVNVYPDTLLRMAYRDYIDDLARGLHGFPVNHLVLEISEKFPLPQLKDDNRCEDPDKPFRRYLKQYYMRKGVRFAVDDYGVGHAASQRLFSAAADIVKIDRYALLSDHDDHLRYLFEQAVDAVGTDSVVVEGYDSDSRFSLRELRDLGVWFIQGHLLGHAGEAIHDLPDHIRAQICEQLGYTCSTTGANKPAATPVPA